MAPKRVKPGNKPRSDQKSNNEANPNESSAQTPKTMVIRIGASEVGPSISQLVKDVRLVMEPNTATRLKERRANRLRDFMTMAGPLGVNHFLLFSRSSTGNLNLRFAKVPRGPTLHFRVESYSLAKDVQAAQRHPKTDRTEYHVPPLLVMNNFFSTTAQSVDKATECNPVTKHLESLVTTMFQSLVPAISPQKTPLASIKRVLLIDRQPANEGSAPYVLSIRHYAISTVPVKKQVPRPLRRLSAATKSGANKRNAKILPNLRKLRDISDYMLDPDVAAQEGFTSGSDSEQATDAEVDILPTSKRKPPSLKARKGSTGDDGQSASKKWPRMSSQKVEKRAVKLVELGPRLSLRLVKIEDDMCGGRILWHEHISKSPEERREIEVRWTERRRVKEERRRVQRQNVERKRAERRASAPSKDDAGDEEGSEDEQSWDSDDLYDDDKNQENGMTIDAKEP